jgi:hypothetical protein
METSSSSAKPYAGKRAFDLLVAGTACAAFALTFVVNLAERATCGAGSRETVALTLVRGAATPVDSTINP